MKRLIPVLAALLSCALLCACGTTAPLVTADPYAGMVQVESGYGMKMWVNKLEDVPVNDLTPEDFSAAGRYVGEAYTVTRGADVSEHQGQIDWSAAAQDLDFAIVRVGYRGYGLSGVLKYDAWAEENLRGALENRLDLGVYFFSQATNEEEAVEEAEFLLALLDDYGPEKITLPVFYDWEDIAHDDARTDGMDGETVTRCALAFCRRIEEAGYRAGLYAYRYLGYFSYDLSALKDYALWIGAIGSYPDFYYAHEFWQYSAAGSIHGISGEVDLDLRFVKNETNVEET